MIKAVHSGSKLTLLDIKTKDGRQIFRGEVNMHNGSFIDTDNAKVFITEDHTNDRYICEIEVQ